MANYANYSDFNKPYTSVDNLSIINTNKFFKQDLPEFMLYQDRSMAKQNKQLNKMTNYNNDENRIMATKGIQVGVQGKTGCDDPDPVTELFFSDENVLRVQKLIRREVQLRTNGQYKLEVDQDEADLIIAMRAVLFDMYGGRFLPFKIKHQVKELNRRVINYIVPDMISEMKQEYGYIKEINKPLEPIDRPVNVSGAGRKNLPSITTVWTR